MFLVIFVVINIIIIIIIATIIINIEIFRSYAQNVVFDAPEKRGPSCPNKGNGVIRAMPERKHFFWRCSLAPVVTARGHSISIIFSIFSNSISIICISIGISIIIYKLHRYIQKHIYMHKLGFAMRLRIIKKQTHGEV